MTREQIYALNKMYLFAAKGDSYIDKWLRVVKYVELINEPKDELSCCNDIIPDNGICPTCKEHN